MIRTDWSILLPLMAEMVKKHQQMFQGIFCCLQEQTFSKGTPKEPAEEEQSAAAGAAYLQIQTRPPQEALMEEG